MCIGGIGLPKTSTKYSVSSNVMDHNVNDHSPSTKATGRVSLARENEAGGRKSIFSMLTYRTSFCFWL